MRPVAQIDVSGGRASGVRLEDGRMFAADAVASNADVVHTYAKLLGQHPRGAAQGAALAKKRFSNSLFVLYFGLDHHHSQLRHHTVCFGPRYRELIKDIFKGETLADDFSLYLHAPCVTDPSLAPPGCGSHYVLAPVPHLGNAPIDWDEEGPKYRDRIFDYLEQRYMPGLRSQLVTSRIFTPHDFRDQLECPPRLGVLAGAAADPERLVPPAQPRRRTGQPLPGRRRHPSGRRRAGRDRLGQGHGGLDAGKCRREPGMSEDLLRPRHPHHRSRLEELRRRRKAVRPGHAAQRADAVRLVPPLRRRGRRPGARLQFGRAARPTTRRAKLAAAARKTRRAYAGETMRDPAFAAFQEVALQPHGIAPSRALRLRPPGRLRHGRRGRATRPSTTRCATATTWPAWSG
jgi:hypothetical protein